MLDLPLELDEYELIICGDLNTQVGSLTQAIERDTNIPTIEEFENMFQTPFVDHRSTCDLTVNAAGRKLMDLSKSFGLYFLNGKLEPDKSIGNFTHVCTNGSSVIDIVMSTFTLVQCALSFSVEERVESDHFPILVKFQSQQEIKSNSNEDNCRDTGILEYKISDDNIHLLTTKLSDVLINTVFREMCIAIDNQNVNIDTIIEMFMSVFRQAGEDFEKEPKRA